MSQSVTSEDRVTGRNSVPVRVYSAQGNSGTRMVFAHGGGFSSGTLDEYDTLCRRLRGATGADVVSVDYRLAPDHPFPQGLEDVCDVLREALEQRSPGQNIVIAGDSAGACLAAGAAQRCVAEGLTSIAAQLLIYPMIEYHDRTPSAFHPLSNLFPPSFDDIRTAWDSYLQVTIDQLPAYAVPPRTPQLAGLPPAFSIVAENDPLRFEAIAYAEQLEKAGVASLWKSYDGVAHGFLNGPPNAAVHDALNDIKDWLAEVLDEPVV